MKKQLNLVIRKLDKKPITSLSIEELKLYFDHRLENLIRDKKVLTKNELNYLLSETGPGNRRIDPQLVSRLTNDKIFSSTPYLNIPEFQRLKKQKEILDNYIVAQKSSDKTLGLISELLGEYLADIKTIANRPFIIKANFKKIPVLCLIKNGDWIFPDAELFGFLQECQKQERLPIIVAKKISGILFPVFKNLSVLGLNLYKTYLPEDAKELIKNASYKPEENFLTETKYNGQFQLLDKEYVNGIKDEYWNGDQLKNFFENVLPKNIEGYYQNFLNLKIQIADSFVETVSQFRKNKATKGLLESYETRENLIKKIKTADQV